MTVSRSLMFFILFYVLVVNRGAFGVWLLGTQLFFGFRRPASGDPIRFLASGFRLLASMELKLTGEMELDILVVVLRHLEYIAAICHEDIATLFVLRHILRFAFLEHL